MVRRWTKLLLPSRRHDCGRTTGRVASAPFRLPDEARLPVTELIDDPRVAFRNWPSRSRQSSNALVALFIPVYNDEDYIGQAIESILGQTHDNWVLDVIDNNSDDRTPHVVEEYTRREPAFGIGDSTSSSERMQIIPGDLQRSTRKASTARSCRPTISSFLTASSGWSDRGASPGGRVRDVIPTNKRRSISSRCRREVAGEPRSSVAVALLTFSAPPPASLLRGDLVRARQPLRLDVLTRRYRRRLLCPRSGGFRSRPSGAHVQQGARQPVYVRSGCVLLGAGIGAHSGCATDRASCPRASFVVD